MGTQEPHRDGTKPQRSYLFLFIVAGVLVVLVLGLAIAFAATREAEDSPQDNAAPSVASAPARAAEAPPHR